MESDKPGMKSRTVITQANDWTSSRFLSVFNVVIIILTLILTSYLPWGWSSLDRRHHYDSRGSILYSRGIGSQEGVRGWALVLIDKAGVLTRCLCRKQFVRNRCAQKVLEKAWTLLSPRVPGSLQAHRLLVAWPSRSASALSRLAVALGPVTPSKLHQVRLKFQLNWIYKQCFSTVHLNDR